MTDKVMSVEEAEWLITRAAPEGFWVIPEPYTKDPRAFIQDVINQQRKQAVEEYKRTQGHIDVAIITNSNELNQELQPVLMENVQLKQRVAELEAVVDGLSLDLGSICVRAAQGDYSPVHNAVETLALEWKTDGRPRVDLTPTTTLQTLLDEARREGMQWQPIETAPKDKMIIGWDKYNGIYWDCTFVPSDINPGWSCKKYCSLMKPTRWMPSPNPQR